MNRKFVTAPVAVAILASMSLAGCSGAMGLPLGEPAILQVKTKDSQSQVSIAVTEVESLPASEVPEIQVEGMENGKLHYVHFNLNLASGEFKSSSYSEFSWSNKWSAGGKGGKVQAVDFGYGYQGWPDISGCKMFDSELATRLGEGEDISACIVMVSKENVEVKTVTHGRALIYRRGAGGGTTWKVEGSN